MGALVQVAARSSLNSTGKSKKMVIKDLFTETPKILRLFSSFITNFRVLRINLVKRGPTSPAEFVFIFVTWFAAFLAVLNAFSSLVLSEKLVDFTGRTEPYELIINEKSSDVSGINTPVTFKFLVDESGLSFNLGYLYTQSVMAPFFEDYESNPCIVINLLSKGGLRSKEETEHEFEELKTYIDTPHCKKHELGYLAAASGNNYLKAETNIDSIYKPLTLPWDIWNKSLLDEIIVVPDRTCYNNGFYSVCFDYFNFKSLSVSTIAIGLLVIALTYAIFLSLTDMYVLGSNFGRSFKKFLLLFLTFFYFIFSLFLLALFLHRILPQSEMPEYLKYIYLALGAYLFILLLLRSFQMLGGLKKHEKKTRFKAFFWGYALTWSVGAIVFVPGLAFTILLSDFLATSYQLFYSDALWLGSFRNFVIYSPQKNNSRQHFLWQT